MLSLLESVNWKICQLEKKAELQDLLKMWRYINKMMMGLRVFSYFHYM